MNTNLFSKRTFQCVRVLVVAFVMAGLSAAGMAQATPPQVVTQHGTSVTTAVPDKPFEMKFRIQNTSADTTYNRVKVVFHYPAGDMKVVAAGPANSVVDDDIITWVDVPIAPGKSFYPSFTFKMDAGTPLKTKMRIWVEVTGEGMEATSSNFSVTAVAAPKKNQSLLTYSQVKASFEVVYQRPATTSELTYWLTRRSDKPTITSLQGAMGYHKANTITH